MKCYYCNPKNGFVPDSTENQKLAQIIGLPFVKIVKMNPDNCAELYFHKRECLVNWLNSPKAGMLL